MASPGEPLDVGEAGEPAVVDGVKGTWRVDPALPGQPFAGRAALLSPLDRLIHDRRRMAELFEFEYQLEMYKPAAKRRWGYFALPILYGDRLVGELDAVADRKAGVLRVNALHEDVAFRKAMTAPSSARSTTWPAGYGWSSGELHPADAIVSAVSTDEGRSRLFGRNGIVALVAAGLFLAAGQAAWPGLTGAVGRLLDHDETALRLAGFGWGAAPWLAALAVAAVSRTPLFRGSGWVWTGWVLSGLLILPLGSRDRVDPAVRADMNLLVFSWLCALGAAVVAMLITIVSGMVRGFSGDTGIAAPKRVAACWIVLLTLGGLAAFFG